MGEDVIVYRPQRTCIAQRNLDLQVASMTASVRAFGEEPECIARQARDSWLQAKLGELGAAGIEDLLHKHRVQDEATLRKKLKHHARARGWMEASEFLVGFVDNHGEELHDSELEDWERLVACDDMFLMRLISRSTATPAALDTRVLRK